MVLRNKAAVMIAPVIMMAVVVVVPSFGCSSSSGLQYSVGDSPWTIPPFPDYFTNWSSSHFFKIGDSLVFEFETGRYDVIQVSGQDYGSCISLNPLKIFYGGPAIIQLHEQGVFYFICNFSNYCDLGQKISVTVHDCRDVFPPSPSASPASPIIPPSLPPYEDGSGERLVPVPSPAPSPFEEGDLTDHPPAMKSAAMVVKIDNLGFDFSIGSIICSCGFGIFVMVFFWFWGILDKDWFFGL